MKDHVEIGHLTEYDAFMVNRDQVMDFKIWFKIHANVFNFEKRPPKPYKLLKFSYQFCDNCKILSSTFYLKDKMKIAMFSHFKEYHGNHKKLLRVYMILGDHRLPKLKISGVCDSFWMYIENCMGKSPIVKKIV